MSELPRPPQRRHRNPRRNYRTYAVGRNPRMALAAGLLSGTMTALGSHVAASQKSQAAQPA